MIKVACDERSAFLFNELEKHICGYVNVANGRYAWTRALPRQRDNYRPRPPWGVMLAMVGLSSWESICSDLSSVVPIARS